MDKPEDALLVLDTGNLYYRVAKKYNGKRINYSKFLSKLTNKWNIITRIAFGAYRENNVKAKAFINALNRLEFVTHFEELKADKYYNPALDIAIEVFKNVEKINWLILGTSSLAYAPLIRFCKEHGIKVCIAGCDIDHTAFDVDYIEDINETYLAGDTKKYEVTKAD